MQPSEVGLSPGGVRRAPGLRREELAQLAGLSVDYIIRLEQGRATNPSPQVLSALARALRLSSAEREHLYVVAGRAAPSPSNVSDHVPPGVQRLLDQLTTAPLSVYDAAWNLILWNPLWTALLGDPTELRGRARNAAWWAFVEPPEGGPRVLDPNDTNSAALVSDLRATAARYPDDAQLHALIRELLAASADFAALWDSAVVGVYEPMTKSVDHPVVGPLDLDCDIFAALGADLRIVAFTAPPGGETAKRLRLLDVVGTQDWATPTG